MVLQEFLFGGTNEVLVNRDPLECFTAFGGFLFVLVSASCCSFRQHAGLAMANPDIPYLCLWPLIAAQEPCFFQS